MRSILELGYVLDREWRKLNYDDIVFPRLAADVLSRSDAWHATTVEEIVDWFASGNDVPVQFLDGFGQPNVRIFSNHKFRIELLFWFDSTTSIHEHSFSGAFGVVAGSSLHTQFEFVPRHRACAELTVGELNFCSSEVLERGALHTIEPGPSYVHSLYHLDHPSVSMVVRTHEDRRHSPQMHYMPPGLAEAGQYEPYPHKAVLALLEATARIGDPLLERCALSIIEHHDILTAFRAARTVLRSQSAGEAVTERVLSALAERDEILAAMLTQVVECERRDAVLIGKRAEITDPEQRFLLALLLNVPDRITILSLVRERFPGVAPEHKICALFQDMSTVLDLPLRGKAMQMLETAISSTSLDAFLAASKDEHANSEVLERVWRGLSGIPAFAPLFDRVP